MDYYEDIKITTIILKVLKICSVKKQAISMMLSERTRYIN